MTIRIGMFLLAALLQSPGMEPRLEIAAHTPNVPPESVEPATVVMTAMINAAGRISGAMTLQGEPPVVEYAFAEMTHWEFATATGEKHPPIGMVFLFRPRAIIPGQPFEFSLHEAWRGENRPALPVHAPDPGYPPNSVAEGAVVLQLGVDPAGDVTDIRVVQGVSSLTEAAVRTVRGWKFAPALRDGKVAASTAIVTIAFRRPVA